MSTLPKEYAGKIDEIYIDPSRPGRISRSRSGRSTDLNKAVDP